MTKEELQSEYTRLVQELAGDIIKNKPTNEEKLKKIYEVQKAILNRDIMDQIKLQQMQSEKESQINPIDQPRSYMTATAEDFRKLVEESEETYTPKAK